MKKINILSFLIASFLLFACSDDKDPVIGTPTAANLNNLPSDSYVLEQEQETETFAEFKWEPASYGLSLALSNALQMDKAGNNFANPMTLSTTITNKVAITVGDINKEMLKLDLPTGQPSEVEFRIVSSITGVTYENVTSNVIKATITPYLAEVNYPTLYTPGNHQGWDPATSAPIYSVSNPDVYEGYLYLDGEFKFTGQPNWDGPNYGAGSSPGALSTDGGAGNINAAAGYYFATVNTNALTYTLKAMAWGVIGSATPTGWDSDTKFTYDASTMTLKIDNIKLTDGELKFRANNDWVDNLGGSLDNLTPGGDNIQVSAGEYTLTLDLTKPAYSAKLTAK